VYVDSLATELFTNRNSTAVKKILVPCGSNGNSGRECSIMVRVPYT